MSDNLSEDVRDLLEAIHEAITIPEPATVGDEERYRAVLDRRAQHAARALRSALSGSTSPGIAWEAGYLRKCLAAHPPTGYVTSDQARAALADGKDWMQAATPPAAACGRCNRPFDPDDTRWNGAAQFGHTPWCRSCVDNCHEGSADHACPICDPTRRGEAQ